MTLLNVLNEYLEKLQWDDGLRIELFRKAMVDILFTNKIINQEQYIRLGLILDPIDPIKVPDNESPFNLEDLNNLVKGIINK